MINKLDCFYIIKNFKYHNEIKSSLVKKIEKSSFTKAVDKESETDISRTDWNISENFQRSWVTYLSKYLLNELLDMYKSVGYDGFTLHEIWFQQYYKNSSHGWHTHSSNFTSVYYVELPSDTPKTKLVNPFDQKTIIEPEIKEGDILIFPSFVLHKAPANFSNKRKTIVSFNTNVTYSNEIYGKGLS